MIRIPFTPDAHHRLLQRLNEAIWARLEAADSPARDAVNDWTREWFRPTLRDRETQAVRQIVEPIHIPNAQLLRDGDADAPRTVR